MHVRNYNIFVHTCASISYNSTESFSKLKLYGRVKGIRTRDGHLTDTKKTKECGAAGCTQHDVLVLRRGPG